MHTYINKKGEEPLIGRVIHSQIRDGISLAESEATRLKRSLPERIQVAFNVVKAWSRQTEKKDYDL